MSNQPLRHEETIEPDEMQQIKDKVTLLLDHGADVNAGEAGTRPVFNLLSLGVDLSPILQLLIDRGADIKSASRTSV